MPLTFDFPFDQLKTYQGINPKPADFDQFWDQSLVEMAAVDPQVELVPVDFRPSFAECFDMYFTGVGGARIHAKLLQPKNPLKIASRNFDVPRLRRQCWRMVR